MNHDDGLRTADDRTNDEDNMDRYLTNKASAFRYPPTPDIASAVRERLIGRAYRAGGRIQTVRRQPRQAWAAMALAAVILAGLFLVVPGARTFVGDIYAGVIHIIGGDEKPDRTLPVPNATPVKSITSWDLHLAGETDIGTLVQSYPGIKLPSDLGLPDRVYFQPNLNELMLFVWLEPDHPDKARLALFQVPSTSKEADAFWPDDKTTHVMTKVADKWKAYWVEGFFKISLQYYDTNGTKLSGDKEVVSGNTLAWADGSNNAMYNLVSYLQMDEAVRIASSLQTLDPVPTPQPTTTPVSPASRLDLTGEMDFYSAEQQAGFHIKVPAYDAIPELVLPQKLYLQRQEGMPATAQVAIMAWFVPNRPDDIRIVLSQGTWDVSAGVDTTTGAVTATVKDAPARWVQAPQMVYVRGPDGKPVLATRSLVTASHALIWQVDNIYYRLETTLPLDQAVKIGEALR